MNLFIINTNKQSNHRYEQEMIEEQKCAAYRTTKGTIEHIQKDDKVLLYSNLSGIIARGIADGELKKKEDKGEIDAEYYMSLNEFYEYIKPIQYKKIKTILGRPLGSTSLKFSLPASKEIWDEVNRYV
ncbi:hypothetical protein [Viridibacillus arvi]|uniref:hypothetical protein n=1 Tax=Viridibacillus arvi TaxID=263475 RepID=UPI00187B291A|nr:hypothetical protein [Viridibacillus sp. JNUCC-6]QOV10431.1 hypothetical protein JNUCC6_17865 [Viridibacillus sp. JNUCC-6]